MVALTLAMAADGVADGVRVNAAMIVTLASLEAASITGTILPGVGAWPASASHPDEERPAYMTSGSWWPS